MWNSEVNYEISAEDGARISCTTLEAVTKMVEKVRKDFPEENLSENIMLSFEFIVGSLFPSSLESLKEIMTRQYIEGYNAGLKENEKE